MWGFAATLVAVACSTSNVPADDDDGLSGGGGEPPPPLPDVTIQCEQQCAPLYPIGQTDYVVLRHCTLCEACFTSCTTDYPEICPNGGFEGGCSGFQPTCGGCVADPCTQVQLPDTSFAGYCATAASTCANNMDCVRLNNCVGECVTLASPMR
jgi:hypothetical protein